ncbi:MAG: substrate-binding domain-containing protein [Clostridiales bacterium]|nr:substrate-binding domain-containing protein [Clostridiales bacterium]
MKKVFSLILVLVLFAFSFSTMALAEDPIKCYAVTVMSGGAAWGRFEEGFNEMCAQLGWEGHYLAPSNANDGTAMVQLAETALNNGADVLLVCPLEPDLFSEVLGRAKEKGVTVIGVAAGLEGYIEALVGTDSESLGFNTAEALVEIAGDTPIKVAVGQTMLSSTLQNEQVDAFLSKLEEIAPDAEVLDRYEMNSNASIAADKLSALYVANPGLNASVSFDSYVGMGAASFVGDYGIADKFFAIGIDDGAEILLCIKDGTLDATIAQQWYEIGKRSVDVAYQIRVEGKTLDYNQGVPTVIIYPDDVDAYAEANGIELN